MINLINKHRNIYLFITTLSIIAFITGIFYYKTQTQIIKNDIKESINIKEDLKLGTNNIFKRSKEIFFIFISSIFIITIIFNYLKLFTMPFEIGFIFSFLTTYNLKFAIIYTLFYYLIPLLLSIILIRLSISLTYNIIKYLFKKERTIKKNIILISKKYLILSIITLLYEIIITIFSTNLNGYLMTII